MNNLVIIGHPDKNSFCHNGIFKTICTEINNKGEELEIIDLYRDVLHVQGLRSLKSIKNLWLGAKESISFPQSGGLD